MTQAMIPGKLIQRSEQQIVGFLIIFIIFDGLLMNSN